MKKVLFVATVDVHIKSFHLPYLKLLHDSGYEVHVATNGMENFANCDKKYTISIERSPFSFQNFKAIQQLKNIIEKEKYDIIHCHTPMGSVVARIAAKKARKNIGTRVIYTCHGFHFYKGAPMLNWLLYYPIEWYLARFSDTIVTINKEDYELANKKFKKRCKDIQYVPGVGIDTQKFKNVLNEVEKEELRKTLGISKKDFVLTCVARLDKNKNQIFLINVVNELIKDNNNIHLLLAGRDELGGYYQNIVKNERIENNIHFLGNRDDVPQLLDITNIVLSASKREGLPVNVIEAFAAGIPVVALYCRGMTDLVESDENGYVVFSKEEFIDRIKFLMSDSKKIQKIKSNNMEKSYNYDIKTIIEYMKKIYGIDKRST